jgi:glucose dehydrogenase
MSKRFTLPFIFFASTMLTVTGPSFCAEVTADREPQNWLMNHRTYDAQRYSPLDRIDKNNVKNLKLAYAVALGGTSTNMNLESTPLAEDGYLYIVDQWGVLSALVTLDGFSGAWTLARRSCLRCSSSLVFKGCNQSGTPPK